MDTNEIMETENTEEVVNTETETVEAKDSGSLTKVLVGAAIPVLCFGAYKLGKKLVHKIKEKRKNSADAAEETEATEEEKVK